MSIETVLPALTAFGMTALVLQLLLLRASRFLPVDQPNARSLHTQPVPRFGGLAILIGGALALPLSGQTWAGWLWPVPVLAAVSLIDDFVTLPAVPRFAVQIGVAIAFAASLMGASWWLLPTVFAMVWMTNLYNFMDGSDALAGSMALIGFGGYALLAALGGDMQLVSVCLVIAGASLAFLLRNMHPARVFMGDAGSIPLGFMAAAIGLIGVQRGLWDLFAPVMLFLVFVADASATLVRRLLRGERVWQAHRTHYYQRLVRMGLGHSGTARLYVAAMVGCAASTVIMQMLSPSSTIWLLAAWGLLFGAMGRRIDKRWRSFESRLTEGQG